eukprot:GILI01001871.1.p1 GENE.GILI01001871.1~~GILI01001871.1.p1  ORF type:complete len:643 (+),score=286.42 GILI01001871.1:79-2007(+)
MSKRTRSSSVSSPNKRPNIEHDLEALQHIATRLRILSVECTSKAGSGHPTSCASMADILAVLFFDKSGMKFLPEEPRNPANDKFVLSKGHAAPILYAAWSEAGHIPREEVLKIREFGNDLEGHPTPRLDFVDVATGSLGQGLGAAAGMAYSNKYLDKTNPRVYCLMGDGESAEGSVWEAALFAGHYKLDNLVAFVDVNRLGQSDPTPLQHNLEAYTKRFEGFGWHAIHIDGHNFEAIIAALDEAHATKDRPTAIIAQTYKGKGLTEVIENHDNWHGKPLADKTQAVVDFLKAQLPEDGGKRLPVNPPESTLEAWQQKPLAFAPGVIEAIPLGKEIATRLAYGDAVAALGASDDLHRLVCLDGDTKNSTFSINFMKKFPERFVECFIAEQNLVSVGLGMGTRNKIPFCSTFGAFFSRTFDQIRMGAISLANLKLVGSHCGVSIGEDGPSQMALEDLAMFRTIPNALVFYPSDAVSTYRAVEIAANYKGIVYIRTSRPNFKVLYGAGEHFGAGVSKVVRQSDNDKVTVVAAGVTLHEALLAADKLAAEGIHIRVVDIFSVKPVDKATILAAAKATNGIVLTVEDHYPEGGLFEAVSSSLAAEADVRVYSLAVQEVPRSGKPQELVDHYGIGSGSIVSKVKALIA